MNKFTISTHNKAHCSKKLQSFQSKGLNRASVHHSLPIKASGKQIYLYSRDVYDILVYKASVKGKGLNRAI